MAAGIDWKASAELSDSECSPDDSEEEITSPYFSNSFPKLQFRKDASTARWDSQIGMAEVISCKGKIWTATGIVRQGKLLCHIEEVMFMVEHGALILIDDDGQAFSIGEIYSLVACGKYGCTWECYQAYCHLKNLGYIVGRYRCPWSLKLKKQVADSGGFPAEGHIPLLTDKSDITIQSGLDSSISNLLQSCYIDESNKNLKHNKEDLKFTFDVYLPNAKFRKSCPGTPNFVLCIARSRGGLCGGLRDLALVPVNIHLEKAMFKLSNNCVLIFQSNLHQLKLDVFVSSHLILWRYQSYHERTLYCTRILD